MATLEIPTRGDIANYDQTVELEEQVFLFEFRYNQRDETWFMNILDESGNRIRSGIRLVVNYPLLRIVTADVRPPGEFVALSSSNPPTPPTLLQLGDTVPLLYIEEADLP